MYFVHYLVKSNLMVKSGLLLVLLALSACGGGGGSNGDSIPTPAATPIPTSTPTPIPTSTPTPIPTSTPTPIPTSTPTPIPTSIPTPILLSPILENLSDEVLLANTVLTEALSFSNTGGAELSECRAETLPAGLVVAISENNSTCEITGTPTELQDFIDYTVTAINAAGESTAQIRIAVDISAPKLVENDVYSFVQNKNVAIDISNLGGGELTDCDGVNLPDDFTIGVSEDATTCTLSGKAIELLDDRRFDLTATNRSGQSIVSLRLTVEAATPFITTWKTNNVGASADNQITITTVNGLSYDYTVDWGDGTVQENITETVLHTYAEAGTYTVMVTGIFPAFQFPGSRTATASDSNKLLAVEQWGTQPWLSMTNAFTNCDNLVFNDEKAPDLSQVGNMGRMFFSAENFNSDISHWDVSNVTQMRAIFREARLFNHDLSNWNVSKVIDMNQMFTEASSFNQDLSQWVVSNVINMGQMFDRASSFNQNLGDWNVSSVSDMTNMFSNVILSTENYDALLNGWSQLPLQTNIVFNAGNSLFSPAAQNAHDSLENDFGWIITDGGLQEIVGSEEN